MSFMVVAAMPFSAWRDTAASTMRCRVSSIVAARFPSRYERGLISLVGAISAQCDHCPSRLRSSIANQLLRPAVDHFAVIDLAELFHPIGRPHGNRCSRYRAAGDDLDELGRIWTGVPDCMAHSSWLETPGFSRGCDAPGHPLRPDQDTAFDVSVAPRFY